MHLRFALPAVLITILSLCAGATAADKASADRAKRKKGSGVFPRRDATGPGGNDSRPLFDFRRPLDAMHLG
ncbi:MAG TPA: hypothetical protein VFA18_11025 [Gemmataceae bacterium]|nr:hypothetical protein [Gemmataceae bacterium]